MRVSYNWLKDYVDVNMKPEKLAKLLTMAGLPVEQLQKMAGDYIFEIEVTSNRPDVLSVIGVAREVAAITGRKLKVPYIVHPTSYIAARRTKDERRATISIRVEDKRLCPRYTARVIRDVKVEGSPEWLKTKIEAMGLRAVNNIVDITNFCLFETGEPMHAFDLDKISGEALIIRRAKKGEKITTIDGVEKILEAEDLVISDKNKPIAIAGIMGGLNTEVTSSTKNVLLEAAYFDPISVRRTSRHLGISTESSYRFERRVDLENISYSSNRALELITKIAGGSVEALIDIGKRQEGVKEVTLRYPRVNKILGLDIPKSIVKKILNSLELKTKPVSKDRLKLRIPHFRNDLQNEIDIIEEISRIYGYDKIPQTMPNIVESQRRETFDMIVEKRIREILTGLGFDEIITYSLLSRKLLTIAGIPDRDPVQIENPLSSEQEVMRPSLIPGMLNAMMWNINRKTKDLKLFELGNVYLKESKEKFIERKHLTIGITGQIHSGWDGRSRTSSFSDLVGAFETLLSELGIAQQVINRSRRTKILPNAKFLEVSQSVLANFDIPDKAYLLEIDISKLLKYVSLEKRFKELPRYPSIFRDISIIVGKDILNAEIRSSIKNAAGSILRNVELIDRYIGRQIPEGKVSLTYRLEYQDLNKTLQEKEVQEVHAKVLRSLEEKLGARSR